MTFEGFDAALVIEGAAFWAGAPLAMEGASDQADTLDAALRAAGQAEQAQGRADCGCAARAGRGGRAAARAEAMLIDLWIGEPGDNAMRTIERPNLAAGTSLHALIAQDGGELDFGAGAKTGALRANYIKPQPGDYVDENGNGQYDEGELIIVTGKRPKEADGDGDPWDPNPGDTGGGGSEPSGPGMQPPDLDCAKDNKALEVAMKINSMAQGGFEYGAAIYKDANGNIVTGSIAYGTNDGTVGMFIPPGVGFLNVLGQVHSHPARGNAALDAAYAVADMYPSPQDWMTMGQLALQILVAGGDPNQLSIYIIDHNGFVREFSYADRMIYDVPASQLLQQPGQPPLPPLPGPMLGMKICGAGG